MITCGICRKQDRCTRPCPAVESLLPKEETGKDARHEVSMDPEAFQAVVDRYSYSVWHHGELVTSCPRPDLSILTAKEKRALLLTARGFSQRDGASLMKISRLTFRTLAERAVTMLRVAHFAHLVEGHGCGRED